MAANVGDDAERTTDPKRRGDDPARLASVTEHPSRRFGQDVSSAGDFLLPQLGGLSHAAEFPILELRSAAAVRTHNSESQQVCSGEAAMPELSPVAQTWVNVVLIWIGFGSMAGLLARAILPFENPSGSLPTLTLGITGSAIGLGLLSWIQGGGPSNPISPLGFLAAVAGAFGLLCSITFSAWSCIASQAEQEQGARSRKNRTDGTYETYRSREPSPRSPLPAPTWPRSTSSPSGC